MFMSHVKSRIVVGGYVNYPSVCPFVIESVRPFAVEHTHAYVSIICTWNAVFVGAFHTFLHTMR